MHVKQQNRMGTTATLRWCVITVCSQLACLQSQVGVIYGNPEVTSGGQALKYYASVRCVCCLLATPHG